MFSCTVCIRDERKKHIKYTILMKKAVDKPRRNQYCIKERMQTVTTPRVRSITGIDYAAQWVTFLRHKGDAIGAV